MSCHIPVALSPTPLCPERFPWPPSELCRLPELAQWQSPLNMTDLQGARGVEVLAGKSPRLTRVCNPHAAQPSAGHTLDAPSVGQRSPCGRVARHQPLCRVCPSWCFLKSVNRYQRVGARDSTGDSDSLTLPQRQATRPPRAMSSHRSHWWRDVQATPCNCALQLAAVSTPPHCPGSASQALFCVVHVPLASRVTRASPFPSLEFPLRQRKL